MTQLDPNFEQFMELRTKAQEKVQDAQNHLLAVNKRITTYVQERQGRNHIVTHEWGCKESPYWTCVYDDHLDPMHDECIFCGDPEERK